MTAVGFREWANAVSNQLAITAERVITKIDFRCRSRLLRTKFEDLGTTAEFTRPYQTQTNDKLGRFYQIALEKWADILHSPTDRK